MPVRDPLTMPKRGRVRFNTWMEQMKKNLHPPFIGVTQGGSSSENPGARPAAKDGLFNPSRIHTGFKRR